MTFYSYFTKILTISGLYLILPMIFGSSAASTTESYIRSVICFFVLLLVTVKLILNDNKYVKYYSITFFVQVIIGLIHYLFFIDSHYFSGNGSPSSLFYQEYQTVFEMLSKLEYSRQANGILYYVDQEDFGIPHSQIWQIISLPFHFLQLKWLNFSPFNCFSSLFASVNLMYLWRDFEVDTSIKKILLYSTSYFPIFILNDTLWRDPFGILLITIALVLLVRSSNLTQKVISAISLFTFSYFQRTVYIILAGIASTIGYLSKIKNPIYRITIIIVSIFLYIHLNGIFEEGSDEGYTGVYLNDFSITMLPIKIFFGLIGPFPWFIFATLVNKNPAFSWQLGDYAMATFQIAYLITLIKQRKQISFSNMDYITSMGFLIMLSGFMTKQLTIVYIAEGLYLTLPWFFRQTGISLYGNLKISFAFLIALNIIAFVIGSMAFGSMWK
jgi:hypothetical protein